MFQIPLNKFEKEKRVIELHLHGKTIREIAKEVHMSFRDISKLIKSYYKKTRIQQNKKEQENSQSSKIKKLSKSSQAYELFLKGKTPVQVAIDLDLDFPKLEIIGLNFCD
jgi:transposase